MDAVVCKNHLFACAENPLWLVDKLYVFIRRKNYSIAT
jgi:hypothetical protein